ncbi:cytochrome c-type biogenesis protein CcmH [bacterium]|nr:cytochrome c-type biogenesis protein CcmH [bacterium]
MLKKRSIAVIFVTMAGLATNGKLHQVYADDTGQDSLKTLQKEIEHSLVTPCCWNMTVDQHPPSPVTRKVQTEIAEFLKQGKSKEEILDYFASQPQYGERILAAPSQKTLLGKLAYWLIPLAFLVGLIIAGKTIKSLARKSGPKQAPEIPATQVPDKKPPSQWDDRFEKEFRDFEA